MPQYPVAVAGNLRAGLVLVNVNPLYTRPKVAKFRAALPKTTVGKNLRRELRDKA